MWRPFLILVSGLVSPRYNLMKLKAMVRKGGFEPPRLSAPPPQDGVSASSTTSARVEITSRERFIIPKHLGADAQSRQRNRSNRRRIMKAAEVYFLTPVPMRPIVDGVQAFVPE
jgi:hypothetical protein